MTPEELDLTLFQLKKYFSSKDMMNLPSVLKNLPSRIHMIPFKNPNTAVLPFWSFCDCYKDKRTLKKILTTKWSNKVLVVVGFIILANWIWNIIKDL